MLLRFHTLLSDRLYHHDTSHVHQPRYGKLRNIPGCCAAFEWRLLCIFHHVDRFAEWLNNIFSLVWMSRRGTSGSGSSLFPWWIHRVTELLSPLAVSLNCYGCRHQLGKQVNSPVCRSSSNGISKCRW